MTLTTPAKVLGLCLLLSFGFAACQSGQTTSNKADSTSLNSVAQNGGVKAKIPTITLDSLIVSSDALIAHSNSDFVFEYFFGDSAITLNGWVVKRGSAGSVEYDAEPTMKLSPAGSTTVTIGPNTYVSDQVLVKKKVQNLVKEINSKPGKVRLVFVPKRNNVTGMINYTIFLLRTGVGQPDAGIPINPASLEITTVETNPSPPHGFN